MNDQGAVLSALVERAAELALAVLLIRIASALILAFAARVAVAGGHGGAALATAAVRLAPRFVRGTVIAVLGASVAVGLPAVAAHAAGPPPVPVLDRVVASTVPTVAVAPHRISPHRPPVAALTYEVQSGDSLWSIAAGALGPRASTRDVAQAWPRWYSANRAVIGDDPRVLRPGQRLRTPAPAVDVRGDR